ncbi:hypothetical protein LEMA_P080960.1 [Plenodomus lingam JN3]|uniref:DUF7702 domain-containing protein n=1 Tax=Leptosphaeria maculans (strain JN3 / isolate v23.1.3 / race Av1-4-5-6-7-8) TaxID=985895 RepID=E5A5F9_LEPMJ|nr:hypothetical protein LEMA_P080960.1 [Plenodomus lingam JN3]CBX98857.1 hypothetical protein LEMA_P080960.1 [Plenodomus lingam JN3]
MSFGFVIPGRLQCFFVFRSDPPAQTGRRRQHHNSFVSHNFLNVSPSMAVALRYAAIVNIITLIIYFIYTCISIWLVFRQGLGRSAPWIWLTLLGACRLTQVSLDLAATTMYPVGSSSNTSIESGVAILTTMGLTPLAPDAMDPTHGTHTFDHLLYPHRRGRY